jgi:membrane glycosyltransferase
MDGLTFAPGRAPAADALPAEAPRMMGVQSLRAPRRPRHPQWPRLRLSLRRAVVFGLTAALTAGGGYEMYQVLKIGGVTVLEGMVLILYALLLAWVAFSFVSNLAGFVLLLLDRPDPLDLAAMPVGRPRGRTAMLLPTYNEDPDRVLARLQAIHESVAGCGAGDAFDWYVLSDSTDPAVWVAEEAALLRLRQALGTTVFYRHRGNNTARKSGNIADWVERFGAGYDYMLILDADSLMTGEAICRLACAMDQHPGIALIQTLPVVVNGRTVFARLQQFAGRLYGPMMARGIAWWHGPDSNYWGHNAIIRVAAFAGEAGLPELNGRKPFGGHILSHDFVEAALMRRAGWGIVMTPALAGSYEEIPPSLTDFAARDRRWCQGNLQHLAVLPARGLYWLSRLHLLTGIGAYLTAPMWLVFLLLGILISLQAQFARPDYFPKGFSLFPLWPSQDPVRAAFVFAATMALLLLPKLLACLLALFRSSQRRGFGGGVRLCAGVAAEILLSSLMAPVMMLFQSAAVAAILAGRDAGWQVQRRDDGSLARGELARRYMPATLAGLAMAASAAVVSVPLLLWMMPVIAGLVLALPLAWLTSQRATGVWAGLWRTPEEMAPPPVLARAAVLASEARAPAADPVSLLRQNDALRAFHRGTLATLRPRRAIDAPLALAMAKIGESTSLAEATEVLTPRETFAALNDRATLDALMSLPR